MGQKVKELEKMMQITRNGKYKLYSNSTRESRGVAIAVKSTLFHEVYEIIIIIMDPLGVFIVCIHFLQFLDTHRYR